MRERNPVFLTNVEIGTVPCSQNGHLKYGKQDEALKGFLVKLWECEMSKMGDFGSLCPCSLAALLGASKVEFKAIQCQTTERETERERVSL